MFFSQNKQRKVKSIKKPEARDLFSESDSDSEPSSEEKIVFPKQKKKTGTSNAWNVFSQQAAGLSCKKSGENCKKETWRQ